VVFAVTFAGADYVVELLSGDSEGNLVLILRILLVGLIIKPFGSLFTHSLIVAGQSEQFNRIMRTTAVLNAAVVLPAIIVWDAVGLAMATVAVAFFVSVACGLQFRAAAAEAYSVT
jgi:O-antigen/teichoic acid export membrane protein